MATLSNNRLLTPELEKTLSHFPLYSQDGLSEAAVCSAIFSIGNIRWYILEGQRQKDDFIMYGIVIGLGENEYGYVSLNEMADIQIPDSRLRVGTLAITQNMEFTPKPLSEIEDMELQELLNCI